MGRVTRDGAGEMRASKALITLYVLTQVVENQVIVAFKHTYIFILFCMCCAYDHKSPMLSLRSGLRVGDKRQCRVEERGQGGIRLLWVQALQHRLANM